MTHSVLVETARRFVTAFYSDLAEGKRIGTAMLAGQHALYGDDFRFHVMGAGELRLKDWFVPVLYQEENDPRLVPRLLPQDVRTLHEQRRRLSLGALPPPPAHGFVGRSRDLLKLERMLADTRQRYAVVRGRGGEGKTTVGAELARWLVESRRFDRAAFVSLEEYTNARSVLDSLGRQLLPEGEKWSVAHFSELKQARLEVERALGDQGTIILLDNMESVLPDLATRAGGHRTTGIDGTAIKDIFDLCIALLDSTPSTRLIFTSREPLPEPFAHRHRTAELRELDPGDAIELVGQVMKREGLESRYDDSGNTPQEITDLVEAVGCHARALTLVAREIAIQGVSATTSNVHRLMEELDRKHPDDRGNSLYASVELSLRRLQPEMQQQVKALGVLHSGVSLTVLRRVLEVDEQTARNIGRALVEVGLAEEIPYGYLRFDPALPLHVLRGLSEEEQQEARSRWAGAMQALTRFLYQQRSQDAELSARLTLLELPNLIALLDWAEEQAAADAVVNLASCVEALLANLGRPQALARATAAREQAARRLGQGSEWGHVQCISDSAKIERLFEGGQLAEAYQKAQELLERCLAAGEAAYPEAGYDISMAHFMVGRLLHSSGTAKAALAPLAEAEQRFQKLAHAADNEAVGMAALAVSETADCLCALGRLDEAAFAYEEAIRRFGQLNDRRSAGVSKGNLGTVRMLQKRYQEALEAHSEARAIFESLGEPGSVAVAWHQIGLVHHHADQLARAEAAYGQALAISVREKLSAIEASSLRGLGSLCDAMGRPEEAVKCYRQAADIHAKLRDQMSEGIDRNNLARILLKLERFDEARIELLRAIEFEKPYGVVAQPWKAWNTLHDLEQAADHPQDAAKARQEAMETYLAYRRDGGENYEAGAQACAHIAQAIQTGAPPATTALAKQLREYLETKTDPRAKALFPKLQAILGGARDPSLADDPALFYQDAVELMLLLESLGAK